ncbi:type I HSP40 co-chaperone HLJ1 SCDLUD_002655 [Saccharomycodes ludwigii]|uniref:type I HSP40 co-chaperone HLJ1 n=1 Tax=Saccharomycodes ludwigii TaxID=36035 RepID=UPI001E89A69B|nr:hypothetical protein SCDLUD_002655 [Saccharomycodes ludwigii]KAH3901172.1 hypothetical protein SCDLUD_002655 [Saccharomycodes ludwigii]
MSTERKYTKEQEEITLKVLKHPKHDFYKILEVDKSANEVQIKKAYRKMAIKLHPDKNSHPRAAEAFKRINRSFEVLSDSNKKKIYDQLGVDPDDRHAAAASGGTGGMSSGFSPFPRAGGPGGPGMRFASPEDFFTHFAFGGDPFANAFGAGRPFGAGSHSTFQTFSFDPNTGSFRANRPTAGQAQRQNREEQENDYSLWRVLLPFLVFLLFNIFERMMR